MLGWITRRQGWLFFPMLTLEGLNLHYAALTTLATQRDLRHRGVEALFLAVRLLGFPALLIVLLGPGLGLAFLAVQLMVFGVYMGASFAPNHKGMPLIPSAPPSTSCAVRCSRPAISAAAGSSSGPWAA